MGCAPSSTAFDVAFATHAFQQNMIQFSAMQFTKSEIRKLYNIFTTVDVDGSGSIALAELLAHIDIARTPFTEKIFSIFDDDKSGEIDFREFVLSLWNYCTLTKATLDMFAFDLYDRDSSGELSASEVTKMLQDIYGKSEAKNNFHAKSVASELKAIENSGQLLTLEQFRTFVKTHQALLFPAFQMQSGLQRKILGTAFWERNANKRIKFSNGKYVSVGAFILSHMDGMKKSPVLNHADHLMPVVEVHGLHKVAEIAGTRASRKKSVAHNEMRASFLATNPSAAAPPGGVVMIKPPPASFSDSAKARWNQSMRNMSGILGIGGTTSPQMSAHDLLLNASNKPRGKTSKVAVSGKDPAEMLHGRVSSTNTNGSSSTDVLAPLRQGGSANNSSGNVVGLVQSMTSPVVSPRDPKDSQKEAQRNRRKSRDGLDLAAVPSGILINSALTTNTLAKIEAASPIEAWHSQPTGRGKAAPSSKQVSNVEVFDAEDYGIGGGTKKARRGSVMAGATAHTENNTNMMISAPTNLNLPVSHPITHKRRQSVS